MQKNSINKIARANQATLHTSNCEKLYHDEIQNVIKNSDIVNYDDQTLNNSDISESERVFETVIKVTPQDTVSALFDLRKTVGEGKIALLNFASYKNPGGGYLNGAVAQEEALCMKSFLYNVISNERFIKDYYEPNRRNLNNGAYGNNHIYSPDIKFFHNDETTVSDVITCAAPNKTNAIRYNKWLLPELDKAMQSRINTVFYSAYKHSVKNLILGAYGCGVFKNDPTFVAKTFKSLLENKYKNVFDNVIFAVLDETSKNFKAFNEVFK